MAIYAFYPNAAHLRRPDGIGFTLAEGADEAAARAVAQALLPNGSIAEWTAVPITAGVPAVAVQGLPVGERSGSTWPKLTRGGGMLGAA